MNTDLWNKISDFNFDTPLSEYSFSTRLARENFWTINFTQKAIVEYKKFMYLAATSDLMVSPSGVIDVVWHQHLIFTKSYSDFCELLGKTIQHVPSTHNQDEFTKFKQAKERTNNLCQSTFGAQPKDIWDYPDMFEPLNLEKARLKLRTFVILGILAFIALTIPCYYILKPVYLQLDNPDFMIGYVVLIVCAIICLEIYNKSYLKKTVNNFSPLSFIYQLQASELVYLKSQKLSNVIHGHVNQLIEQKKITVHDNKKLELVSDVKARSIEEFSIVEVLKYYGKANYPALLWQLQIKPVFSNIQSSMEAFKKYFSKSKVFGKLFYLNFLVFAIALMLGFIRFSTGLLRDKPVSQILVVLVILVVVSIAYLLRLTRLVCVYTIPKLYTQEILPNRQDATTWDWNYYQTGTLALSAMFIPIVNNINRDTNNNWSGSDSSGGGSCGSSCGASCGGCGGD